MVTQHPLMRLMSGWRERLSGLYPKTLLPLQMKILQEFHPMFSFRTNEQHKVPFSEFLQYFVKYNISDKHFIPLHSICHPCQLKYDYVAKIETHYRDMKHIVKNILSGFRSPPFDMPRRTYTGSLSNSQIQQLNKTLGLDMQLFGYSIDYGGDVIQAKCEHPKDGCC